MPAPNEYMVALGHDMIDQEEMNQEHLHSENTPTFTKKKGIWSGLKHMFHQRQRTPSRNRNERRQFSTDLSSLSYSCLGQARQDEEEMYGINSQQRSRLSRNLSMSHESVFQMEPLPSQSSEEQLITPRTSSSTALPMMMQTELQAVLRQRQSRSRNFSKQSNDFTDDEDLGLPKSLQNSPGDFPDDLVVSSVLRSSGPWGASRHHSSCSDNSLLSLDSYDNKVDNDSRESMYYRDKSPGDVRNRSVSPGDRLVSKYSGNGNLSHQAARHKMAIRPKRNHAVRHHRRLQQLEEVHEIQNENIDSSTGTRDVSGPSTRVMESKPLYIESTNQINSKSEEEKSEPTLEEMKLKSKSLDISFRAAAPSSSTLKEMSKEGSKNKTKSKTKLEQEGSFLSRLFGSKRQKMKTSISKTDLDDRAFRPKSQGQKLQANESTISIINMESNTYKQGYYQQNDIMTDANKLSPPKYKPSVKQKPPPPPPDTIQPSVRKSEDFSSGVNEKKDMQTGQRSVPKSQSFRQNEGLIINPGEPEYPSLPAQVSHNDVILKKNKSMSSVLSAEASHQKFRSSIENWSFANEGLKKSIGSLADQPIITSQSNESLKTITSLLEEPDLLEHTSVLDSRVPRFRNNYSSENISDSFTDEKPSISNEIFSILANRSLGEESGFYQEQDHTNVITKVRVDEFKPATESEECIKNSKTESLYMKEDICSIKDNLQDIMDVFHTKMITLPTTSGNCKSDGYRIPDQVRLNTNNSNPDNGFMLSNEDGILKSKPNDCDNTEENLDSDFVPKYQDEEVEKLIKLADNLNLEQAKSFSPTNNDSNQASLEIVESDLDLSINSMEVFHTPESLNMSQTSFQTAIDKSNLDEENITKESLTQQKENPAEKSMEINSRQTETLFDILQSSDDLETESESVNQTPVLIKPPKQQRLQMDIQPAEKIHHDELNISNKTINKEIALDDNSSKANVTGYKPILVEIQNNVIFDKEPKIQEMYKEPKLELEKVNQEIKSGKILTSDQSSSKIIDKPAQKIPSETKKPEISPKPVPAPRHFFLKKSSAINQDDDRSKKLEEVETVELKNVFSRRSKSTAVLGLESGKSSNDENQIGTDKPADKNEMVINVKERAKSFSGLQSYQLGPKPFRPSSIAQEIQMTKPMNIPPKPKLAQKPVPAPRQFRSISNSAVVSAKDTYEKKVTKSASNLQETEQKVSLSETTVKTTLENVSSAATILKDEVMTDVKTTPTEDKVVSKEPIEEKDNSVRLDKTNMEEIQVRKIVNNFQKSKSPEKPIRKFPPIRDIQSDDFLGALPVIGLTAKDDTNRNVMSMVTKLNALSTTTVLQ